MSKFVTLSRVFFTTHKGLEHREAILNQHTACFAPVTLTCIQCRY